MIGTPALLGGLLDPNWWIQNLGPYAFWGTVAIIFIECWLFPILPGDSLLFTVGLLIASGEANISEPIWLACIILSISAVASNVVGYGVGRKVGPPLFERPDSKIFKPAYIDKTIAFFDKHGNKAIVMARFVPIVRTFITLAAGVGKMEVKRFVTYSAIGGVVWATGVTLLGYWLGNITFLKEHIDLVLLGIVALSVVPLVFEAWRSQRMKRDPRYDEPHEREAVYRKHRD